ncbi:transposase [Neochlamydia sp. EPS4]|uniref:IS66 family transposase n=1 Tax=Neochlamydia sp. EPS4 TaxID=1478175 RepID=UPI0005D132D9|nr:transposase [Neochlamydia sp. EPS4]
MGKAISYLNNYWEVFTLFLRIPGVPLTNNIAERMMKKTALNRKIAYFFRNETGAKIADILMSVMETSALNHVNSLQFSNCNSTILKRCLPESETLTPLGL